MRASGAADPGAAGAARRPTAPRSPDGHDRSVRRGPWARARAGSAARPGCEVSRCRLPGGGPRASARGSADPGDTRASRRGDVPRGPV